MAINTSFKRWLVAFIIVIAAVIVFDWLFNHHRLESHFLDKRTATQDSIKEKN
jgi:hypothetical protein